MAPRNSVKGSNLLIMVGNGATPELYVHPCFINTSRKFSITADVEEYPTYDCLDPDALTWKQREKTELSSDIEGAGTMYQVDMPMFDTWIRDKVPKNVKIKIDASATVGGGSWLGLYHLTSLEYGAEGPKGTIECNLSLVSTGYIALFAPAT